jgi:hypothetical protein
MQDETNLSEFNHYEFGCLQCGETQFISYHKELKEPDLHLCCHCSERYWWSNIQKKLYRESTKEVMPDSCMKLL